MKKLDMLERVVAGMLWLLMIVVDVINRDWDTLKEDWSWMCGTLRDLMEEEEDDT